MSDGAAAVPPDNGDAQPHIFMLSWERPLYLWACLDSFFRHTMSPARFVMADNASADPLIDQVITGFERRQMFDRVYRCTDNNPLRFPWMIERHWHDIDEFFVLVECDTAVEPSPPGHPCWLENLLRPMREDPRIGAVGSRVWQRDFVSIDDARQLSPGRPDAELASLIKLHAPMRRYQPTDEELIAPHNPPLRLLALRKAAYAEVGFGRDVAIHRNLLAAGWKSVISTRVVHRHLSLLNIYDYPDYGVSGRDAFFSTQVQ